MDKRPFTIASFDQFLAEGKFMGMKCSKCGAFRIPPKPMCSQCYSTELEWVEMTGKGTLSAYSCVAVGTTMMVEEGYDRKNLYCTGVISLEEGPRICAQIIGADSNNPESIKIGTPLKVGFVERGKGEERRTYLAFNP